MPMPEDSLLEHAAVMPPRSKAWRALPQMGKSPPRKANGPKQHPTEHPQHCTPFLGLCVPII